MKSSTRSQSILRRFELAAGALVTAAVLFLHFRFFTQAGPLWRDEISSLNLALLQNAEQFFRGLVFDSMPALFPLVLRAWSSFGFGQSDFGLRLLGLLIGVLSIVALWVCCRSLSDHKSAPLWPIVLFAMNLFVIGEGDSLRPYGLGVIGIIVTFALIWRITFRDRYLFLIIAAAIAAVLSVQSLYFNSFALFGICFGGILLCALKKDWQRAGAILFVGVCAVASLLPYLSILRQSRGLFVIQATGGGLPATINEFIATLGQGSRLRIAIWFLLFVVGLAGAIFCRPRHALACAQLRDSIVFSLVTVFVATIGTIAFVWNIDLPVNRYFLPLLAVAGVCAHICAATLRHRVVLYSVNIVAALVLAALSFFPLLAAVRTRATNCDLAANAVSRDATSDDFIIVTRFSFGISFARYYRGAAPWRTVPDIPNHTQHRLDLVKDAMTQPDPLGALFSQIESTLKAGHRVYLVGSLPAAEPVEALPPAPQSVYGWKMFSYIDNWQRQLAWFVNEHAQHGDNISLGETQPVELRENLGVFVVSGWQDRQ
jgi:hypothetical protein